MFLVFALVALHLGAAAFALMYLTPVALALALVVLLGASLAWQCWRLWLGGPLTVRDLTLDAEGYVYLTAGDGAPDREHRLASCRILPGAVVLGLRPGERQRLRHLVLPFDALSREDARRLRASARRLAGQEE